MKQILRYSFIALMAMFCGSSFADTTDELTPSSFGIPDAENTYADFNATGTSGAAYIIQAFGKQAFFQIRSKNNNSGLVSTSSAGFIKSVSIEFNAEKGAGQIDIYGSNEAYTSPTNLYDDAKGTLVGSISESGSYEFNSGYKYIGLRSNNGARYIDKITIVWTDTEPQGSGEEPGGGGEEVHIANTAETAYTVAKAIELIDAGEALTEEVYVTGLISKLDNYKDGSYTYWISEDGTTEAAQFECYKGKGIDGADFTSAEDLKKGATVIVKGTLTKYKEIYEFNAGNVLVSYDESTVPAEEVHIANTAETAYTVAKAIELIDAGDALTEEVYVTGMISQIDKFNDDGSITYWISDDGATTTQFECYKGKGKDGADFTSVEDLKKGSTVIVKGTLTKYKEIYEFNAGNVLVSYDESTAVEEKHIANTAETAYTVAEAIDLIDAGESLQETVYVKGIISKVETYKDKYKSIDYWISDDGTTESAQFECYSGKGIDGADFESIDDIQVGATVIVKGTIKKYGDIYEFNQSNELVEYEAPATGINNLKTQKTEGVIYNLAGQRVEKATKGIYIQNGKKFIVK